MDTSREGWLKLIHQRGCRHGVWFTPVPAGFPISGRIRASSSQSPQLSR